MLRQFEVDFLSITLKQTKAGLWSSGTPVVFKVVFKVVHQKKIKTVVVTMALIIL